MKCKIKGKLASVYSEIEVTKPDGTLLYSLETEPLSAPRTSHFKNAAFERLATVTTVRTDTADRANHVAMADGRAFDLKRKFRNPASTTESFITVSGLGYKIVTRRAWTNRFEIRRVDGAVLAEARQIAAERGDTYELTVKDKGEAHAQELILFALIARDVMRRDTPVPV